MREGMNAKDKKLIALNIAAIADIAFDLWIFFWGWMADGIESDDVLLALHIIGCIATGLIVLGYIRLLHLDVLESLKPICGAFILLFWLFPFAWFLPENWPYHYEIWTRGTRGLVGLIVIAIALFYLIKTRKQKERHKQGMAFCLFMGLMLSSLMLVQVV